MNPEDLDYSKIKNTGTGSHEKYEDYQIIPYNFDKYVVKVKLSLKNEFIGIVEIKLNKDFLSQQQKISASDYHDVEEFYQD